MTITSGKTTRADLVLMTFNQVPTMFHAVHIIFSKVPIRGRICWTDVQSLLRPPSASSHEEAAKKTPLRTQLKTCQILYFFLLSSLHDLAYDSNQVFETVILKLSR